MITSQSQAIFRHHRMSAAALSTHVYLFSLGRRIIMANPLKKTLSKNLSQMKVIATILKGAHYQLQMMALEIFI